MRYLFLGLVFSAASAGIGLSLGPDGQSQDRPSLAQAHAQYGSAPQAQVPIAANFASSNRHNDCANRLNVLLVALQSKSCS